MYVDEFLKYRVICIAYDYTNGYYVDNLLNYFIDFIGKKCTIINEQDTIYQSSFGDYTISFKNLNYNDIKYNNFKFLLFKQYCYKSFDETIVLTGGNRIMYNCDLILNFYDKKIFKIKDRNELKCDLNELKEFTTETIRFRKIKKLKNNMKNIQIGKQIAYILRHNPGSIKMDTEGYINVIDLLNELNISKDILDEIVSSDDKNRYSYDGSGLKIRANQGHSLPFVNITFKELKPPKYLYHGTSPDFIKNIMEHGLLKMSRQYVHLSNNKDISEEVGKRYSKKKEPVILTVDSLQMYEDGYKFYLSDNGVWLTDNIPPKYLH